VKQASKLGTSGRYWRSVVRDHWQSQYKRRWLRLPQTTATSYRPALRSLSYSLPNHVDDVSVTHAEKAFCDLHQVIRPYFAMTGKEQMYTMCVSTRAAHRYAMSRHLASQR